MKILHNVKKLYTRRKELRNNATKQESLLWENLKHSKLGVKFRRQHSIGFYIADFYCPSRKLIIEIDGSSHNSDEQKLYDKDRTEFLLVTGTHVIRFTNNQIDTDIGTVLETITNILSM